MAKKDYYKILGITDEEKKLRGEDFDSLLKKKWKKLALKFHPDRYAGKSEEEKKQAEEKFKEIAEAYGVLSDKEKKERYDKFGDENATFDSGFSGFSTMDFDNFFKGFGFNPFNPFDDGANFKYEKRKGKDIKLNLTVTLEEIYNHATKKFSYERNEPCSHCHGSGLGKNGRVETCPTCQGKGYIIKTSRTGFAVMQQTTTCPTCHGTGEYIVNACSYCHGTGLERKTVTKNIQIPSGCCDGAYMPLVGGGNYCERADGDIGNLIIIFKIAKHKDFDIDPNNQYDLVTLIDVPVLDCIIGEKQSVKGIDGKMHKFDINKGTTDGNVYILKGLGMPKTNGTYGDLHIYIRQKMPRTISSDELNKIYELKKSSNFK